MPGSSLWNPWEEEGKQPCLKEIENQINPIAWAAGRPKNAKWTSSVKVDLKPGAGTPNNRQYALWQETLKGICPIIQKFQEYGLIWPCCSTYNTRFKGHKWYCIEQYTQGQSLVFSIGLKRCFAVWLTKTLNHWLFLNVRTQNLGSRLRTAGRSSDKSSSTPPCFWVSQDLKDLKLEEGTLLQYVDASFS